MVLGELVMNIKSITDLARIKASFIVGMTVILGTTVVTKQIFLDKVFICFLVGFVLSASTNTLNDIMDLELDRIEKSERPLPRGDITVNQAWFFFIIETFLALISSLMLSLLAFYLSTFVAFISLLYSFKLKNSLIFKNTLTAFGVSSAFLVGVFSTDQIPIPTILFFFQIFITVTAFEIHKDIADIVGDKKLEKITIATRFGTKKAAYSAFFLYIIAFFLFQIILIYSRSKLLPLLILIDVFGTILGLIFLIPILGNQDSQTIHSSRKKIMALLGIFVIAIIISFLY